MPHGLSKTETPMDRRGRRLADRHRRQARIPCSLSVNRPATGWTGPNTERDVGTETCDTLPRRIADSGRLNVVTAAWASVRRSSDRPAGVTSAGCCWPSHGAGLVLAAACGLLRSGLTEDFAETRRRALWVPQKEHHDDAAR
jgi:hypothetical protein